MTMPSCCAPRASSQQLPNTRYSICLILGRWGSWPPWAALLLRTMQLNPTVRFLLLGDMPPAAFDWPQNTRFERMSLQQVLNRAQRILKVQLPSRLSIAGGSSKISDFKPMFGELFARQLTGCDFWGYLFRPHHKLRAVSCR